MASTDAETLTGRAPTSPADFYVRDATVPSGLFTRVIAGTVAGFAAALQGSVAVGAAGNVNWAIALRGSVSSESGATVGSPCPLALETHITDAPTGAHVMMRFNTDVSKDTPDYWFMTSNPQAIAYEAGVGAETATKYGAIKIMIVGGNIPGNAGWIRVYQGND